MADELKSAAENEMKRLSLTRRAANSAAHPAQAGGGLQSIGEDNDADEVHISRQATF